MGFVGRSLLLFFILYGMLFAVANLALLGGALPLWGAGVFMAVMILLQYLLSPWLIEWFYSIGWYEEDIPPAVRAFVDRVCTEHNLPKLRIGIIESATPNAFAFGRLQSDARIVVTRGLLELLSEDEANAVLAHEIGHVAHYDFAAMAAASMVPLALWQIYVWTNRNNRLRLVSYVAYLAYWIGQFMVLMLNRTREYGADQFSAQVARQPNALSTALVKIAYGMVKERGELTRLCKQGDATQKKDARRKLQFGQALSLMGIMNASNHNAALALGIESPEQAVRVMRWDLVNPWAAIYELNSTHPLTAKRIEALNREAKALGQSPAYAIPQDKRLRWTGFPVEFLIWSAPLLCGFLLFTKGWLHKDLATLGIVLPAHLTPWLLTLLGVSWALRIAFRYHGQFKPATVENLLDDLAVSQMRPRAVAIEGEIVGNGLPGAYWSPDLLLRDDTGLIFLYYRSSIPFGRLFFALRSADRMIGERVKVQGWYRRGMRPYIEMSRVEARVVKPLSDRDNISIFSSEIMATPTEYEQLVERSYSCWIQLAASAACTAAGLIWLLS
jgi:heat shock protein HtpX